MTVPADDPDALDADGPPASPRCSVAARARQDALAGTALPTGRFLLIEDPGPWGPAPHPIGSLPDAVAVHVHEQARLLSARLLLIRRTGRRAADDPRRAWARVDTDRGEIVTGTVETVDGLRDIEPADIARAGGRVDAEPWYLVCTQGRHDVCCAVYGRPVVQALAEVAPERTWECSHVGGDRFAANVVLMPSGLVYGHVDADAAIELVEAFADGRVVPRWLRGRCGNVPAAQVAEHHARELLDDDRLDAFETVDFAHVSDGRWRVGLVHRPSGRRLRALLAERHEDVEVGLTCAADGVGRLRRWELIELD